jgi:hypothetical protein
LFDGAVLVLADQYRQRRPGLWLAAW